MRVKLGVLEAGPLRENWKSGDHATVHTFTHGVRSVTLDEPYTEISGPRKGERVWHVVFDDDGTEGGGWSEKDFGPPPKWRTAVTGDGHGRR